MNFLIIVGILVILAGLIFLSGEKNVRAVNKGLTSAINKTVFNIDEVLLKYRVGTGLCLLLIGLFCLFIAYYVKVMAPHGVKIF